MTWLLWGILGAILITLEHYIYSKSKGRTEHFDTDDIALIVFMIPLGPFGLSIGIICALGITHLKNMVEPYKESSWL